MLKFTDTLEADFVILGGGTAGLTFAKYLTDNKKLSAIVVEAGPNLVTNPNILNPVEFATINGPLSAIYLYQQQDLPNPNAAGRNFQYSMGRTLGGGSSTNGSIFSKSYKRTFAQWEELAGPLWNPDVVYQNYKELESYHGDTPNPDSHGCCGPLSIRQPKKFTQASIDAVNGISFVSGLPPIPDDDYNNPDTPLGPFHRWELTQFQDKTRGSSQRYFNIADPEGKGLDGRQLLVLKNSTAVKLIFDDSKGCINNAVIGVEIINNGVCQTLKANKEVILAMGIHSSEFLQRSGIGPASVLENAGVKVRFDNPNVGANLKVKFQINGPTFIMPEGFSGLEPDDLQAIYTAGAYIPDTIEGSDKNARKIHIATVQTSVLVPGVPPSLLGFGGVLLQPLSTGSVQIQNADPFRGPLANNAVLMDPADLASLKSFVKTYVNGLNTYLSGLTPPYILASPTLATVNDDALLTAFVQSNVDINFRLWQCTNRMNNDPTQGVCNGEGLVYGAKNLRMGDASTAPIPTDGVPQAAAYLVAYTLSKQILKELGF